MSITFRIATAADHLDGPIATINARQLAALRTYLREEGVRIGTVLLDPDAAEDAFLSYHFEARVCPLALAALAKVFDFAADVISVVEEAQFRSRRISVYRCERAGTIHMRMALTSDLGLELDLASSNAYAARKPRSAPRQRRRNPDRNNPRTPRQSGHPQARRRGGRRQLCRAARPASRHG